MPRATLSTHGRVVIPKSIRQELGLRPGDCVEFILREEGEVVLRPIPAGTVDVRRLKGFLHRPGQRPVSVAEMHEVVARRAREAAKPED